MAKNLKLMLVAGARPNFMKIAPLISAIKKYNNSINSGDGESEGARAQGVYPIDSRNSSNPSNSVARELQGARAQRVYPIHSTNPSNPNNSSNPINPINYVLVHTGQHYDVAMSETFFHELDLPHPDINLDVGSGSHAIQTAQIMIRFEGVCLREKPDWVVVVGDVNSTMACTLVAAKLEMKVAHVEAGLRSFDRTMPEEINRLVTDTLSDLLFTPSADADENLINEGITVRKIKRVGNIMIDTLLYHLEKARQRRPYMRLGLEEKNYVFVTLHRPVNVDDKESILRIMDCLIGLSKKCPVIFPVHPRTRKNLFEFGIIEKLSGHESLMLLDPLGYYDTIGLVDQARFVLTDSGGLQEETTFLKIPCLTLRPNTERPVTLKIGTSQLTCIENLNSDIENLLHGFSRKTEIPELWDGKTGERIIDLLAGC